MNKTQPDDERHAAVTDGFNVELFRGCIKARGWSTATEAARQLGLHRPDYYRILDGQLPGLHKGLRIAERLGVKPLDLWPDGYDS